MSKSGCRLPLRCYIALALPVASFFLAKFAFSFDDELAGNPVLPWMHAVSALVILPLSMIVGATLVVLSWRKGEAGSLVVATLLLIILAPLIVMIGGLLWPIGT